jgi:hypothetical protein
MQFHRFMIFIQSCSASMRILTFLVIDHNNLRWYVSGSITALSSGPIANAVLVRTPLNSVKPSSMIIAHGAALLYTKAQATVQVGGYEMRSCSVFRWAVGHLDANQACYQLHQFPKTRKPALVRAGLKFFNFYTNSLKIRFHQMQYDRQLWLSSLLWMFGSWDT